MLLPKTTRSTPALRAVSRTLCVPPMFTRAARKGSSSHANWSAAARCTTLSGRAMRNAFCTSPRCRTSHRSHCTRPSGSGSVGGLRPAIATDPPWATNARATCHPMRPVPPKSRTTSTWLLRCHHGRHGLVGRVLLLHKRTRVCRRHNLRNRATPSRLLGPLGVGLQFAKYAGPAVYDFLGKFGRTVQRAPARHEFEIRHADLRGRRYFRHLGHTIVGGNDETAQSPRLDVARVGRDAVAGEIGL